jgi:hypothetical protein
LFTKPVLGKRLDEWKIPLKIQRISNFTPKVIHRRTTVNVAAVNKFQNVFAAIYLTPDDSPRQPGR